MPVAKLVIGPAKLGEIVRKDDSELPHVLRAWLNNWHATPTPHVVATYSPVIIDGFVRIWGADALNYIVLRKPRLGPAAPSAMIEPNLCIDTPLLVAKDRNWLAHFAISDLYMRGELNPWLTNNDVEEEF